MVKPSAADLAPRLLNRQQAARYLGCSVDTMDRLIHTGEVDVVRVPVERSRRSGRGVPGGLRRILVDKKQLDTLIDIWRAPLD